MPSTIVQNHYIVDSVYRVSNGYLFQSGNEYLCQGIIMSGGCMRRIFKQNVKVQMLIVSFPGSHAYAQEPGNEANMLTPYLRSH